MSCIAVITARGGSKRIPRKNIKDFLGKPIIAYSIETALSTNLFDEVMVSTDDAEIAEIAEKYGAKVPFLRSKKNADDFASTVDVILEVLSCYQNQGKAFKYGCCIYPTAPFISEKRLQEGRELLLTQKFDTVFPVTDFSSPIQRALKIGKEGKVAMFQPQYLKTRSQDLENAYHDSGQFYWFNSQSLFQKKALWTDNSGVIKLPEIEVQDIDNIIDWQLAELKYQFLNQRNEI